MASKVRAFFLKTIDAFAGRERSAGVLVRRCALIALGAAIYTFGVHNIHEVTGITEGGVIGLMLFLNKWLGIPSSVASPVLDIVCYVIALRVLGGGFLGWSAVATVAVAGFYRLWESLPHLLLNLSGNPLMAAVLGGVFVGVGVGLVVRQGGSSGGDDALALSISKISGWRVARCYLFTDLTVLALSLSYIPVLKIACSLVTVTISSLLIDLISSVGAREGASERGGAAGAAREREGVSAATHGVDECGGAGEYEGAGAREGANAGARGADGAFL